jgi:hypothetical protein
VLPAVIADGADLEARAEADTAPRCARRPREVDVGFVELDVGVFRAERLV